MVRPGLPYIFEKGVCRKVGEVYNKLVVQERKKTGEVLVECTGCGKKTWRPKQE